MAPFLDSYRPAGNRYPLPKAARMRQRRAERFESTRIYRPAGNRYPSQNAARMRQRRADRFEHTPPPGRRSAPRSTAFSSRPYVSWGRPSNSRAEMSRPSARAYERTMRRPFRELPDNSAGIFKCEPGVAQRHERHGASDKENQERGQRSKEVSHRVTGGSRELIVQQAGARRC